MSWIFLILAGIMEIGWPLGMKYAWQNNKFNLFPAIISVVAMALSGLFLFYAQKEIPIGTAYVVWTGIGAIGTFTLGIILFDEPAKIMRILSVSLILMGIVGLKITSN